MYPWDWTKGDIDIDGDGFVGIGDLNIILGHFSESDPDPFLGTNLGQIEYWKSHWVFVDAMKMGREWEKAGGATSFTTDADGWPTSIVPATGSVFTQVFADIGGAYPAGDYVLTYEGTADVAVTGDVTGVTLPDPGNPRRKVVSVVPGVLGIKVSIANINAADPPKDIRLWMPGFENATSPFHPYFLDRLRTFKVLRFMDWQKTNHSPEVQWSGRKLPTEAFQNDNDGGVALEYLVQLCNELEADAWFCMPHQADDNYVTQFARLVRDGDPANNVPPLHAGATIYIEWSNEVWNSSFGQYHWVAEEARQYVVPPLDPQDPDPQLGAPEFYRVWAEEAANDFTIWKSEFVSDPRQLIRVAAGWKDLPDVTDKMTSRPEWLDPADTTGNDVLFDAIACSTYLRSETNGYNPQSNPTGVEDILNYTIHRTIPLFDTTDPNDPDPDPNPKNNTRFYMDHAGFVQDFTTQTGRPISFISYEGGQHFVPNDKPTVLKLQINGTGPIIGFLLQRHPLMYKAYVDNIAAFKAQGGSLFMAYNSVGKFTEDDTFGHFEYQNESINDAPKHRAVIGGGGR